MSRPDVLAPATLAPEAPVVVAPRRHPLLAGARGPRWRDADVYALCALLVVTAAFGRSFSKLGVPGTPVYVTELVLAFVTATTLVRLGAHRALRIGRTRLPLAPLGVYLAAGAAAAVTGLLAAGWSQTLNDVGLLEYALVVPIVALVVDDRQRLRLVLRALLAGSLVAAGLFLLASAAWVVFATKAVPEPRGGSAAGLYMSLFVIWAVTRYVAGKRPTWPIALAAACGVLAVGLTAVRGAWVTLFLGLVMVAALAPRGRRVRAWVLAPAIAFFALASAALVETASERAFGRSVVSPPPVAPLPPPEPKPPIAVGRGYVADDALTDFGARYTWRRAASGRVSLRPPINRSIAAEHVTGLKPGRLYTVRFSVHAYGGKGGWASGRVGDTSGYTWGQATWYAERRDGWVRFERTLRATQNTERLAFITATGTQPAAFDAITVVPSRKRGRPAPDPLGLPSTERRGRTEARVAPRGRPRPPATESGAPGGSAGSRAAPRLPPVDRTPATVRELRGIVADGSAQAQSNRDWRLAFWGYAAEVGLRNPLRGLGFGKPLAFEWRGRHYDFRNGDPDNAALDVTAPHNGFVHVFARMGVPGLAALVALIAVAALRTRSALRRPIAPARWVQLVALGGMLAAAVVTAALNDALKGPYTALFFWTVLALLLIEARVDRGPRDYSPSPDPRR